MKIFINNNIFINDCTVTKGFIQRLLGKIISNKPLMICNCNSIHTFFIKENLDIIFLNNEYKIIKIYRNIHPNTIIFPLKQAKHVLEISANTIKSDKIKLGDILVLKK